MNRIAITIYVDVPEGVTPDVSYGAAPVRPAPSQPAAQVASSPAAASWVCPEHGTVKTVPAGTSKKTGKPYNAFLACTEPGCDQKPPRGNGPSSYTPAPQAPAGDFDDLPF